MKNKITALLACFFLAFCVNHVRAQTTPDKTTAAKTKADKAAAAKDAKAKAKADKAAAAKADKAKAKADKTAAKTKTTATAPAATPTVKPNPAPVAKTRTVSNPVNKSADKAIGTDAKGRTIYQGPRGGKYTLTAAGNKEYIKQ